MIHASILGRLGKDPELKTLDNGTAVLNFNLATDHGYGQNKKALWIRCAVFGKRAETLSQHLAKGSQVLVQGELYTREWEKKDGTTATDLECRVAELEFAGSKSEGQQAAPEPKAQNGFDDRDVPFAPYLRGSIA
jgi:single-strand DNA-binding protein